MTKRKLSDTDDSNPKKHYQEIREETKPKKAQKKEINFDDDADGVDLVEQDGQDESERPKDRFPNQIPVKRTKKRKQTKGEATKPPTTKPNPDQRVKLALKYLKTWYKHRDEWKFQKVRQMCLLQHMYDQTQISDKYFKRLLAYLEGLTGASKEKTIKEAGQILVENDSEGESEDKDKESEKTDVQIRRERATQILRILS
ncbi:hypothetical protein LOTGIDRAFT_230679 [Lottia gigantea]|uniref:WKF domain-containing protein n=1 Tax=Lottia gigantea TaxID=225164 RepID=V4B1X7_LOTGI|nr:hypothetical protein LOTGIDRAFT_230679 [Lottia gigantea]ESP01396.1 hypothetical protein LOTGIDRAFT_230679 [Lottia gigantea]